MTVTEVTKLLGLIAGFDRRTSGQMDDVAWTMAAEAGGWTFELARRAVVEHYTHSTDWLMPAHITQRITEARQTIYATFRIPLHPAELADDGPAFVAWAQQRAAEHMAAGLAQWAEYGHLPVRLELEA